MDKIIVILITYTLYNKIPYGPALFHFKGNKKFESFKALGVFNDGKLHNAPLLCITSDGYAYSFMNMMNGRPEENSWYTKFQ